MLAMETSGWESNPLTNRLVFVISITQMMGADAINISFGISAYHPGGYRTFMLAIMASAPGVFIFLFDNHHLALAQVSAIVP